MKTRDKKRSPAQIVRELPSSVAGIDVCKRCGGENEGKIEEEYRPERLGIDGVVLYDSAMAVRCKACGTVNEIFIPNAAGLMAAVALTRIKLAVKLSGKDIRFLRRALDLTGKALAERLEVQPETLSRWEHGDPIGPVHEKLLRLLVGIRLHHKAPLVRFDPAAIEEMKITFHEAGDAPEMHFRSVPADVDAGGPDKDDWVKAA